MQKVREAFELDPRDDGLLGDLERLAEATGSWETLRGLVEQVSESDDLDRDVVRDLQLRAASWYRTQLRDLPAAERCLEAAIVADPDAEEAHAQRVELLRAGGRDADLCRALSAWADIELDEQRKLDKLREAAAIAEEKLGDSAEAAATLEIILDVDPTDRQALDDLVRLRTLEKDFESATSLLERRIDAETDATARLRLRHQLAEMYAGPLDRREDAIEAYRGVMDEDPTDMGAIDALEGLYEAAAAWEELEELIEQRLNVATGTTEQIAARVRLARLHEQRFGRRAEAIDQLREILELDSDNTDALSEMERLLEADEQWEPLVDLLENRLSNIREVHERVSCLERLAGLFETQMSDHASAISTYERILAEDPTRLAALGSLVELHERAGDLSSASDVLERMAELQSGAEAESTLLRLADMAADRLHDPARAETALRRAVDIAGDRPSPETVERLRKHYESQGDHARLAELLMQSEQFVEDPTEKVSLLKRAAELYEKELEDHGLAAEALERASSLVPDDRDVLLPLCDLYVSTGRSAAAVPVLEKIVASFGNRRVKEVARYHHRLGRALEEMGDLPGALKHYDSAFKIDLTNVAILRDLGRLCHRSGDLERAQKTFRALLLQKLDGDAGVTKADVYFFLGDISAKQGDKAKAISMLQRAVAEQSDHDDAQQLLAQLR